MKRGVIKWQLLARAVFSYFICFSIIGLSFRNQVLAEDLIKPFDTTVKSQLLQAVDDNSPVFSASPFEENKENEDEREESFKNNSNNPSGTFDTCCSDTQLIPFYHYPQNYYISHFKGENARTSVPFYILFRAFKVPLA